MAATPAYLREPGTSAAASPLLGPSTAAHPPPPPLSGVAGATAGPASGSKQGGDAAGSPAAASPIHSLYIFNRRGACLYYKEWSRPRNLLADSPGEDTKLMFGLLFSLQQLVGKLSPSGPSEGLRTYRTASYALHYFEAPTGYKFALTSTLAAGDMRPYLRHVYQVLFVESVLKNPLYRVNDPITCMSFTTKLEEYMASIPIKSPVATKA